MLPREEALEAITDTGILAVVRLNSSSQLQTVAQAIQNGGVRAIEFTMTTPGALDVLKEVANKMNGKTVFGAGTVLDAETARAAILAGAKFIIAPNFNIGVVATAHRYSVAVIPGAYTSSEIITAWEADADMVKIFPASVGGPELIKALRGPFPQIKMIPTGGVDINNAAAFIEAGSTAVAIGGNLINMELIKLGKFDEITNLAKQYVEAVSRARKKN